MYKVYLNVLSKIFVKYVSVTIFVCYQIASAAHQSLTVANFDLNSSFP